jgi:hypothetical protein
MFSSVEARLWRLGCIYKWQSSEEWIQIEEDSLSRPLLKRLRLGTDPKTSSHVFEDGFGFLPFWGIGYVFALLMVVPRASSLRFTPLSQTYHFKALSIMNPFQQLQQKANRMQGGGSGGQQNEEAQLWQDKLLGKTLINDDQETDLGGDKVSGLTFVAVLCSFFLFSNWLAGWLI